MSFAQSLKNAARNTYARAGAMTTMALVPMVASAQGAEAAFAAAQTEVTASILIFAGGLVAIAAVSVGFMVAVKYVKKIGGAA